MYKHIHDRDIVVADIALIVAAYGGGTLFMTPGDIDLQHISRRGGISRKRISMAWRWHLARKAISSVAFHSVVLASIKGGVASKWRQAWHGA